MALAHGVSVIIPCYNEYGSIGVLLHLLAKHLDSACA